MSELSANERCVLERIYSMWVVDEFPDFGDTLEMRLNGAENSAESARNVLETRVQGHTDCRAVVREAIHTARTATPSGLQQIRDHYAQLSEGLTAWEQYREQGRVVRHGKAQTSSYEAEVQNLKRQLMLRGPVAELTGRDLATVQAAFASVINMNMQVDALMVSTDTGRPRYGILVRTGEHNIFNAAGEGAKRPSYRVLISVQPAHDGDRARGADIWYSVLDPFNLHAERGGGEYDGEEWSVLQGHSLDEPGKILRLGYGCWTDSDGDPTSNWNNERDDVEPADQHAEIYVEHETGHGHISCNFYGMPHPHLLLEGGPVSHQACMGSYGAQISKEFCNASWFGTAVGAGDFISTYNTDDTAGKFGVMMYAQEIEEFAAAQEATQGTEPAAEIVPDWRPTMYLARNEEQALEIRWADEPHPAHHIRSFRIIYGAQHREWTDFPANQINEQADFLGGLDDGFRELYVVTEDGHEFTINNTFTVREPQELPYETPRARNGTPPRMRRMQQAGPPNPEPITAENPPITQPIFIGDNYDPND